MFLEISQNLQENTCARVSFLVKLHAGACEFCEIFINNLLTNHLWATASDYSRSLYPAPHTNHLDLPLLPDPNLHRQAMYLYDSLLYQ